jgi:uncharacterized membrane protein
MSTSPTLPEPGRATAFVVYLLYLLSIPSFFILALIGVIIALSGRAGAGPVARSHLDDQIRIWFIAFWWAIALGIGLVIGAVLIFAFGLGLLIWWLIGIIAFVVMLWFTIKSLLGLLALVDNRPR